MGKPICSYSLRMCLTKKAIVNTAKISNAIRSKSLESTYPKPKGSSRSDLPELLGGAGKTINDVTAMTPIHRRLPIFDCPLKASARFFTISGTPLVSALGTKLSPKIPLQLTISRFRGRPFYNNVRLLERKKKPRIVVRMLLVASVVNTFTT